MKNPNFNGIVAGMDEAGRGSWAGPVVAAAVILPKNVRLSGLDDSKKLTTKQRETLFQKIKSHPHGIGVATHTEVDEFGLLRATFLAFSRALEQVPIKPDHLYIDGNDKFNFPVQHTSVIRGDQLFRCIAAASILAKVARDRLMVEWGSHYANYKFELHKGYGTELHQKALQRFGPCPIHRLSYKPIQKISKL